MGISPSNHVTQVGETVLPNIFLKWIQLSTATAGVATVTSPAKRTLRFLWGSGLLGLAWLTDG
jgi:hypothetical protein